MRAACNLYEHPQLSDSEIWNEDAYNRSGRTRVLTVLGALFIVTAISTFAVVHYTGALGDAITMPLLRALL